MTDSAARQSWPRRDDITPHPLVQAVAEALAADHADCDPESCCQRNSGPDWVEAHKALAAINDAGYRVLKRSCDCACVIDTVLPETDFEVVFEDD